MCFVESKKLKPPLASNTAGTRCSGDSGRPNTRSVSSSMDMASEQTAAFQAGSAAAVPAAGGPTAAGFGASPATGGAAPAFGAGAGVGSPALTSEGAAWPSQERHPLTSHTLASLASWGYECLSVTNTQRDAMSLHHSLKPRTDCADTAPMQNGC